LVAPGESVGAYVSGAQHPFALRAEGYGDARERDWRGWLGVYRGHDGGVVR
jgi:hypothetical protein